MPTNIFNNKRLLNLIKNGKDNEIKKILDSLPHPADISDILNKISEKDAIYVYNILEKEKSAQVFNELEDEELKKGILKNLTSKDIAEHILEELDSDDATDIVAELPDKQKTEVIQSIKDTSHAKDIVELLRYEENTAGALMAKEYIAVNQNRNVFSCIREMRRQAEEVKDVLKVFVVDNDHKLKGFLSLKKLLTTSTKTTIKELYNKKKIVVKVDDKAEEVASIMKKYDLFVVPVVDALDRLVGIISIDDIVDFITEEAEKDYQLASGLSYEVETKYGIFQSLKARIPWLFIGLVGGFFSGQIIRYFELIIEKNIYLVWFIPLIAAMGGNVGIQSSAVVIQGLANKTIEKKILYRLLKEGGVSILNGFLLSGIIILIGYIFGINLGISFTVSLALIIVMLNASIIGSFIPLMLNKLKINPAIATGPFITTTNDILGVLIYFLITKSILGL